MDKQRGFAHLLILLLLVLIVFGAVFFLKDKLTLPKIPGIVSTQQPKVAVKTEYQNPFKKVTQYVNPFDQYKSPFVNLKK